MGRVGRLIKCLKSSQNVRRTAAFYREFFGTRGTRLKIASILNILQYTYKIIYIKRTKKTLPKQCRSYISRQGVASREVIVAFLFVFILRVVVT